MIIGHQTTFDCHDPHLLVRFWAEAMDLEVEIGTEFINGLIADGHATEDQTVVIDGERFWTTASACSNADRSTRLLFQQVDEPTAGKNRVHLDLRLAEGVDRDAWVARMEELGATRLWEGSQGPVLTWVTMADPEGNEFCVA